MDRLIFYIVLCGGAFGCVFGMGQLVIKRKKQMNLLLGALCISVGILLFHFCNELRVGTYAVDRITDIYEPSLQFVTAVLIYFSFSSVIDSGFKLRRKHLMHFLPPLFFFLVLLLIKIVDSLIANDALADIYDLSIGVFYLASSLSMVFYSLFGFRKSYLLIKAGKSQYPEIKIVTLVLQLELILISVLLVFASMMLSFILFKIICLLAVQLLLTIFLLLQRYPEYVLNIQKAYSKARYEQSKVIGLDVSSVVKRLRELMEIERVYENEDLSLGKISDMLNISSQQLSQVLNETMECSFPRFVTQHRLKAAKELLTTEKHQSILSIAFAVGFKSKSSFNASFKNEFKMTPSEYRKLGKG